jgi:SAM-dependent methyltransferase
MRWGGYRQFLQHFLNPLLLESYTGVSFAPFFCSGLDGVASDDLLRLLPMPACLRPAVALHVWLPTLAERRVHSGRSSVLTPLPKARYIGLLRHMQTIIEGLVPRHRGHWRSYTLNTSYSALESEKKLRVVADFMQTHRPACLLDVGCNKGQYAAWALQHGARHVVGYDADRAAAGAAFTMASAENLSFVPLTVDIANPSPAQGWQGSERASLASRVQADAMMALALVHHLAIARNIPLAAVIEQLVALAPRGLIEFVPKQDRQVIELLQHREDIFPDYHYDAFIQALGIRATVVSQTPISESGRMLVEFERFA